MVDGSTVSGIYFCTWRTRRGLCICDAYFCLWGAVEFNCPFFLFIFFFSPCDCLEVIIFPSCHLRWFSAKANFSPSQTTAQSVSARCYETNTSFFCFFFEVQGIIFLCDLDWGIENDFMSRKPVRRFPNTVLIWRWWRCELGEALASIAILLTLAAAQLVTLLLYEKRHI